MHGHLIHACKRLCTLNLSRSHSFSSWCLIRWGWYSGSLLPDGWVQRGGCPMATLCTGWCLSGMDGCSVLGSILTMGSILIDDGYTYKSTSSKHHLRQRLTLSIHLTHCHRSIMWRMTPHNRGWVMHSHEIHIQLISNAI